MTDEISRIVRLEEQVKDIGDWRSACAMLPVTVAELLEWKRMQNGYLRDLRDDMAEVKQQLAESKGGSNVMWKVWTAVGAAIITSSANLIVALLR